MVKKRIYKTFASFYDAKDWFYNMRPFARKTTYRQKVAKKAKRLWKKKKIFEPEKLSNQKEFLI